MLKVSVVDANDRTADVYRDVCLSVVGQWLLWEMQRAGVPNAAPTEADVVFLVHAGALDWAPKCRSELRRVGIQADPDRRGAHPYIIAGGSVCTTPLTALEVADGLVVGEGYRAVRAILAIAAGGGGVDEIRQFLIKFPHAIERSQVVGLERDADRPWLLAEARDPIAEPDAWIDWSVPPVKSDDRVVRIIGAKGCARKCIFCSTSWSQRFQVNPRGEHVVKQLHRLAAAGERVQLLSNDPSQIPYYRLVKVRLDSESYTVKEGL